MLVLFLILPLFGVILLNILPREGARKIAWLISGLVLTGIMVLTIVKCNYIDLYYDVNIPYIDYITQKLSMDFFSALLVFTISLIGLAAVIINRYSKEGSDLNFNNLILLITIGMNGIVLVHDIFSLYIFLEITAVASFIFIGIFKTADALEGAFKYFIMSAVATIFMLSAIAFVFTSVGSLEYADIYAYIWGLNGAYPITIILAFIFFLAGLSIKAGLVPFHGWLPDAYSAAPNSVSVLLGGIVTKITGVYTIMRLSKDVFGNIDTIQYILAGLGLLSVLAGAFAAIGQSDFKRLLAYSSISQVGYIILGAATGSPLGFIGAFAHLFNHAIFKSTLFINASAVELQTGTRDINTLGGLASRMPVTGGTSIIAFLSTAGVPPLSGFWSKLLIIMALWQSGFEIVAAAALLASLLTLGYFLVLQRKVFFGKIVPGMENITEVRFSHLLPAIVLSLVTIVTGLAFPFILEYLQKII